MRFARPSSLLWTFAGTFLGVLVLAMLLQGVLVVVALQPLSRLVRNAQADVLAREIADELGRALTEDADADVLALVTPYARDAFPKQLVPLYRDAHGRIVAPPESLRPPRDAPPGERRARPGQPPAGRRGGPGHRLPPRMQERFERFIQQGDRIAARAAVTTSRGAAGEVLILAPPSQWSAFRLGPPAVRLLFIPVAILGAGGAGLILFRLIVRRIRNLESLATRVTKGDLEARVHDPRRDELGTLAMRLNEMTAALETAREQEAAMHRTRRQLLADISHELATPLTSIRGYAETLLNPDIPADEESRERQLAHILDEAKRMDLLIHDLLELTRLEAGALPLERERLDWASLCKHTIERFRERFERSGLRLVWAGGDAPAWVEADGRRLEQVLENLLVNSLRYVPAGGTVRVLIESDDDIRRLVVADDGPGFPPEHLPHVFERFYRADASRSEVASGLGLAIVSEIARRHGGAARARNGAAGGARLEIELRSAPATQIP